MPEPSEPNRTAPADAPADNTADLSADPSVSHPGTLPEPSFAAPAHSGELGTFGRYRVLQKLGQGGMGAVYLGFDCALNRKVALKVMLPHHAADVGSRERFLREARAAAAINSDYVVTIHDVGEERGVPFIAMEYLLGSPLDQFLKTKGDLPLDQALRVAHETALGLAAAHDLGLIHRDIKPGNIWLAAPKGRVKILDFGLARAANDDENLTGSGAIIGTPAYMSPEQGRGLKVDHRTDLFSLGVMLYRLTTGKMPFTGAGAMGVLTSLAVDAPSAPRTLNPQLPEAVEAVITRLLAKEPVARFQTAQEVADALLAVTTGPLPSVVAIPVPMTVGAQTQSVWEGIEDSESHAVPLSDHPTEYDQAQPLRRRSKTPVALGAIGLVAALAAGGAFLLTPRAERPQAPAAPAPAPHAQPAPARQVTADRRVAELLRPHVQLRLTIPSRGQEGMNSPPIGPGEPLPEEPFTIASVLTLPRTPLDRETLFAAVGELRALRGVEDHCNALGWTPGDVTRLADGPSGATLGVLAASGLELDADVSARLKRLPALHTLLVNASRVDDAALERLAADLPRLRDLTLREFGPRDRVGRRGAAAVTGMSELHTLCLARGAASPGRLDREWFRGASRMRGHMRLGFKGYPIEASDSSDLAGVGAFASLGLEGSDVTDAALAPLAGAKTLKHLNLAGTQVTGPAVKALAHSLPGCRIEWSGGVIEPKATIDADRRAAEWVLSVGGKVSGWDGSREHVIQGPGALPAGAFTLTAVDLKGAGDKIRDSDLEKLAGRTSLTHLALSQTAVTDAGMIHLKGMRSLEALSLGATKVDGSGLIHLKDLPALNRLEFWTTPLTTGGVERLKDFRSLRVLHIGDTRAGDAALAHVKGIAGLKELILDDATMTDTGLAHLADAKALERLHVRRTNVTLAAVAKLQAALPQCKIEHEDVAKPKK